MKNKQLWLLIFCVFLFMSCKRQTQYEGILIAVSIPPQQWFVSQIAGYKAQVILLLGPGQNHHNYEPSPRQIQSLSHADAWILSGAEFEISLLPRIRSLFPNLLIVDGTQGVHFRMIEEHNHEFCSGHDHHHHHHDHSSLNIDRHSWLGREPAKILARHIRDTLSLINSENKEYFYEKTEYLISQIDKEFDRLKTALKPLYGRNVFVYHPSFGYFFDEFGISQTAVEVGGREPGPRDMLRLTEKLQKERALDPQAAIAIFVQAQFPVAAARTLAETVGAQVISLDHMAEDWLENIRRMGDALQKVIP